MLTSWSSGEDGALFSIDEERAGILTVDFITPVVDDPVAWGEIAAANSLSDVFAMGGRPLVALNVVGFPTKTLGLEVLESVLSGGLNKVREAGAFLLGGHSVEDNEPKYGLVVYGEVPRSSIWRVTGARAGDLLVLTKPLGTGIVTTALKAEMLEDTSSYTEAVRWMSALNDIPRSLAPEILASVHACTDVTGFGLAGHALDMLSSGGLNLLLGMRNLPLLPGVHRLAASGLVPAGTYNNRVEYQDRVTGPASDDEIQMDIVFDAQTSGGLLLAVPEAAAADLLPALAQAGFPLSAVIGRFVDGEGLIVVSEGL